MIAWNEASELKNAALGRQLSLAAFAERERKVRRDFWAKLKRVAGMVPFVEDLVAAYYCALDPATPMRVRGMLLAALAYFILPIDIIPDMIAGLGFADDAALLTAVIGLVASHITPTHRAAAARALDKELPAAPAKRCGLTITLPVTLRPSISDSALAVSIRAKLAWMCGEISPFCTNRAARSCWRGAAPDCARRTRSRTRR